MTMAVRLQLSVMMFIQFFVWGVWFVSLATYLFAINFTGTAVGSAYGTTNWGAIIAPFIVGMIADRFFSAERVLGVLHLIGAGIMWYLSGITDSTTFFFVALAYAFCYMPTLALVNAISFEQMKDPTKEFPGIRVLGTAGWIVAGLLVGALGISEANGFVWILGMNTESLSASNIEPIARTEWPLKIAAISSLIMGVYSFFLPHTPPKSQGKRVTVSDVLGLDALRLMKEWSFSVFVVSSLLISIPLAFYYGFTNPFLDSHGVENATGKQTLGQFSEVAFMLVMPFLLVRLGVKKMLLIGMLAWAVRYFFFAYGPGSGMWMWYVGILLHGICYDFFFVTGQLYVDRKAPESVRASAQGFIGVITYGIGMVIGSQFVSGPVVEMFKLEQPIGRVEYDWTSIWLVPGVMALVVAVLFAIMFHENNKKTIEDEASA
ncbi:MAG: nucleoside permease [Candidatus Hydrogenedentes bacterium]|nr:nucleoside permease [Candidatus Hydrogenedentota bacterium]